tara:strand:+ start:2793 stop:3173 length:381 start_codon:yes stop_codon:yes gene_type:complete
MTNTDISEIIRAGVMDGTGVVSTSVSVEDDGEFFVVYPHGMTLQRVTIQRKTVAGNTELPGWGVSAIVHRYGGPWEEPYDDEVELGEAVELCSAIALLAAEYARAEAFDAANQEQIALQLTEEDLF